MTRLLVAANVFSLAGAWAVAILLWPHLPGRVPSHFDVEGIPDRWGAPSMLEWLVAPIAATVFTVLIAGAYLAIGALARKKPSLINVPYKSEFIALLPEARERVIAPVRSYLWAFPLCFDWLAAWLAIGIYRVATGAAERLEVWPIFAAAGLEFALAVHSLLVTRRLILQEIGLEPRAGEFPPGA